MGVYRVRVRERVCVRVLCRESPPSAGAASDSLPCEWPQVCEAMVASQQAFRRSWEGSHGGIDFRQVAAVDGRNLVQVCNQTDYVRIRSLAEGAGSELWAPFASQLLHWHHNTLNAWLCKAAVSSTDWQGWSSMDGAEMKGAADGWQPWRFIKVQGEAQRP